MPKTKQQKKDTVAKLTEKLSRAKSVVFADYRGMTMKQLSELRKALKGLQGEFAITKNNLLKIALKNSNLSPKDDKLLEGPIATLFSYDDEVSPIKSLAKNIKDSQIGILKGGILGGNFLTDTEVNKLAILPTKDELRAKVVGGLSAPLYGMVGVLQANLRNLVYALEQIRVQKGGDA